MSLTHFLLVGAALLFGGFYFDSAANAEGANPPCKAPANLTDLEEPLPHTTARIAAGEPVTIVAIGSSSTAGAGASKPEASYPNRLAVELAAQFPRSQVTVINRGMNGQESSDMLARLKSDVLNEKPTLVIWQVGTNSVLRDQPVEQVSNNIDEGLEQIKAAGADVILVDPQYAPRVLAKPEAESMVTMIDKKARRFKVGVFHRFAVMRHWRETSAIPFETFTSADGLHHNDWSYACWAKLLSTGITQAVTKPTLSAHIR
jgi:ABC-type Fe3+-hydroxamate transport system substrate-binding protein